MQNKTKTTSLPRIQDLQISTGLRPNNQFFWLFFITCCIHPIPASKRVFFRNFPSGVRLERIAACFYPRFKNFHPKVASAVARTPGAGRNGPRSSKILGPTRQKIAMNVTMDESIKRWTAKRKMALVVGAARWDECEVKQQARSACRPYFLSSDRPNKIHWSLRPLQVRALTLAHHTRQA
jgi:hypothetical protein